MAQIPPSIYQGGNQYHVTQRGPGPGFIGNNFNSGVNFNFGGPHDETNRRLKDLFETDPATTRNHILQLKGVPLKNTYEWIFDHQDYKQWRNNNDSRLLWIKAGPGKGKTMLMCSIITQITEEAPDLAHRIAYFFCQATEPKLSKATAVLRGLVFLLMKQDPSLWSHVPSEYDIQGKEIFESKEAFNVLSTTLTAMLQDPKLEGATLIIDALDECTQDLKFLLNFIAKTSRTLPTKWIVSSRDWPMIDEKLTVVRQQITLCLESNHDQVLAAVNTYIHHKVDVLAEDKGYSDALATQVQTQLKAKAGDTFLWVALVCQTLEEVARTKAAETLAEFPEGLDAFYDRMIDQLHDNKVPKKCTEILGLLFVAYQPLNLQELAGLLQIPSEPIEDMHQLIIQCGSFLIVKDNFVYFVHQSAKDFLTRATSRVWSKELAELHAIACRQMLWVLIDSLQYNMYEIEHPGTLSEEVQVPCPDPLGPCRYSCVYWAHHFCDSAQAPVPEMPNLLSDLESFLKKKFVYWLEALSLIGKVRNVVLGMKQLEAWNINLVDQALPGHSIIMEKSQHTQPNTLKELIHDAFRFTMSYRQLIEEAPLQVYASALVFSPSQSVIRNLFAKDIPKWIQVSPGVKQDWGPFSQNLEGHSGQVNSIAVSMDGQLMASGSWDNTVRIWDLESGGCLHTLTEHKHWVEAVTFWNGEGGQLLASGSWDSTIKVWDVEEGRCIRTLHDDHWVVSIAFSPRQDKCVLASGGGSKQISIWDADNGIKMHTLCGHSHLVRSLAFSPLKAGQLLASGSRDHTVRIWDAFENTHIQTLAAHNSEVDGLAFSRFEKDPILASGSKELAKIWKVNPDTYQCTCLHSLPVDGTGWPVPQRLSLSHNGKLAFIDENTIKVWDACHGTHLNTISGQSGWVTSVDFTPDSRFVIGGDYDCLIRVWDAVQATSPSSGQLIGDSFSLKLLKNGLVAGSGLISKIPIWDATSLKPIRTISVQDRKEDEQVLAYCPTTGFLASGSSNGKVIYIWDPTTATHINSISMSGGLKTLAYSGNGLRLASSTGQEVKIWTAERGELVHDFSWKSPFPIKSLCLSSNGALLAFHDHKLYIKDLDRDEYLCDPQSFKSSYLNTGLPIVFSDNDQYVALGGLDTAAGKSTSF
ncbi:Vegetative incompatibility protein HET-E-1 [Fusarium austroafricanum]|uniref:Mitochondrial division protein 1 n=1 Tax=Fusarium austroafricanum TaxID=2364996 RepID=A0A8H4KQ99_9HYPO|nr:Vegetative incompatibility protein HET-E-1 [Fusarium austroafricanum]